MTFFIMVIFCVGFGAYILAALIPKKINHAASQDKEFFPATNVENPFPSGSLRTSPTIAVENFYNWYVNCTKAKSCQLSDYSYIDKPFAQRIGNTHAPYNLILCSQIFPSSISVDQQSNILDDTTTVSVSENFVTNISTKIVKILVTVRLIDGSWYILTISCQNKV